VPPIKQGRACGSGRIAPVQGLKVYVLVVLGPVLLKELGERLPPYVPVLLGEVEQQPQLEAGVGNRELNSVFAGDYACLIQTLVLIDVEHAPDLVVAQVVVTFAVRLLTGLIRQLGRVLHEGTGIAPGRLDVHTHRSRSLHPAESVQITGLGDATLAHDKEKWQRIARWPAPAEAAITVSASPAPGVHPCVVRPG
jgi:hypothetical protein